MTDQDKITALRDAAQNHIDSLDAYDGDLVPINRTRGTANELRRALAMTAEASEPSGEPVDLWPLIDAYSDFRAIYQHSTDRHMAKAQRWNVENAKAAIIAALTHPATKQASAATKSEAALQALSDQSQELEFTPTRRAFDQSALDSYAERAK